MRIRKVDSNQARIVDQLRRCGYSVAVTSSLGTGFPDIVVGCNGHNFLFEIKDPAQPPSHRKLTQQEAVFKAKWRGQYHVIETFDDAYKLIEQCSR